MIVKSNCEHCQNPIEFEAEHTGQTVECPHCGKSFKLMLPENFIKPKVVQPKFSWKKEWPKVAAGTFLGVVIAGIILSAHHAGASFTLRGVAAVEILRGLDDTITAKNFERLCVVRGNHFERQINSAQKFLRAAKAGGVGVRERGGGGLPGGNQLGEPFGFGGGFGERRETAQRAPAFAVRVVHDLKNCPLAGAFSAP